MRCILFVPVLAHTYPCCVLRGIAEGIPRLAARAGVCPLLSELLPEHIMDKFKQAQSVWHNITNEDTAKSLDYNTQLKNEKKERSLGSKKL